MSSRSATVLVIFSVACIAFCLASVFAAMTGPISILPNESDNVGILDNLSALTDQDNNDNNYQSYSYDNSYDYSSSSDDSQSDDKQVETTTDNSNVETTTDDGGSDSNQGQHSNDDPGKSSATNVEHTISKGDE